MTLRRPRATTGNHWAVSFRPARRPKTAKTKGIVSPSETKRFAGWVLSHWNHYMRRINHFAGLFVFNGLTALSFRALVALRPLDRKSLSPPRAERALRPAQGRLFEHDAFRTTWPSRKAAATSASEVCAHFLTIIIVLAFLNLSIIFGHLQINQQTASHPRVTVAGFFSCLAVEMARDRASLH